MTSTRKKMYESNTKIKSYLKKQGFTDIYSFLHTRFSKDYHLGHGVGYYAGFDAFAWKDGVIWFFQFKTNKKAPAKELTHYKILEENYKAKFAWVTTIKGSKEILFQHG